MTLSYSRLWLAITCVAIFLFFGTYAFAENAQKKSAHTVLKDEFAIKLASYLEIKPLKKVSSSCYQDLLVDDESTPLICALKKKKIFKTVSQFSPASKTTWGLALESICRAKQWTKEKTFSKCLSYAKKHALLPASAPKKLSAKTVIKRQQLDDLFILTIVSPLTDIGAPLQKNAASKPVEITPVPLQKDTQSSSPLPTTDKQLYLETSAPEVPQRKSDTRVFTPFPQQQIGELFFANFKLTAPMPNHFYKDEVYIIEGDLLNGIAEEVFIFLCRDGEGCTKSKNFLEKTTDGRHFKIPVFFEETGNFQLGLIAGKSGQSRIENISVLSEPSPFLNPKEAPKNLSTKYIKGSTKFSWDGAGYLTRLIIYQGSESKDYIFRQLTNTFAPLSKNFGTFKKGEAWWLIDIDGARSKSQRMSLTTQTFREVKETDIEVTELQDSFHEPSIFRFKGKALKPISKKAAVTLPNGKVQEITFATKDIQSGGDISIEVNLKEQGTYIFEVNNPQGAAAINLPLYVGDEVPLLPDFFTTNTGTLNAAPIESIKEERAKMLTLINKDRAAHDLTPVHLWDELNVIAQAHSQDMKDRNFFGHNSPDGITPDDRRKKARYPAGIRENLGKASSLEHVEEGLMRSPIHRGAIIDPNMKRVGIGIVKNTEGYYFVTQNFSATPMTNNDVKILEEELFNKVQNYRIDKALPPLHHDAILRDICTKWSSKMASENFFATSDERGNTVTKMVRAADNNSALRIHIVKSNTPYSLEDEIFKQEGLYAVSMTNLGIGMAINDSGDIYMTMVYAQ